MGKSLLDSQLSTHLLLSLLADVDAVVLVRRVNAVDAADKNLEAGRTLNQLELTNITSSYQSEQSAEDDGGSGEDDVGHPRRVAVVLHDDGVHVAEQHRGLEGGEDLRSFAK